MCLDTLGDQIPPSVISKSKITKKAGALKKSTYIYKQLPYK